MSAWPSNATNNTETGTTGSRNCMISRASRHNVFKRIFRQTKSADLPHSRQEALKKIKKRLGWRIRDENIYLQSLKHRSASSTHIESNERLELLGDAVLGLLTCEHLYLTRPGPSLQ